MVKISIFITEKITGKGKSLTNESERRLSYLIHDLFYIYSYAYNKGP